jgi:hypothetical protein
MFHVVVPVPSPGMMPPPVRHRRRCRDHGRGRRSGRRRRRAGSQCESRDKSGRAERPASRDKTHVSPPRVESDTLYQLDTQSRAVQDQHIIAPSRLFSMGNLTSNRRNDDDSDLWRRRSARRNAQYNPSTPRRGVPGVRRRPPASRFVPTGAIGRHGPSDASVVASRLVKSGVPGERILLEETGFDTLSSVQAIQRLLRETPSGGRVMVATSAYHLPRCLMLLCLCGIAAHSRPPPTESAAGSWWKRWYWRL